MNSAVPSRDVRERTLAAVRAHAVAARTAGNRFRRLVLSAGALYLAGAFAALGGLVEGDRPAWYVAATGVAWALVASAATWAGVVRGRSMLGRSVVLQGWTALGIAPALGVLALVADVLWPAARLDAVGMRAHGACFALALLLSIGPLAAFVLVRRGSEPVAPRRVGALLGAVSGAWAGLAMDLHCSHTSVAHVLGGHVLPVFLTTGIGYALGAVALGIRRR
ncbi:MAG: NrsF family protein [Polyangiaceae bacterium]